MMTKLGEASFSAVCQALFVGSAHMGMMESMAAFQSGMSNLR